MASESDPRVVTRTILIGSVFAAILLLLLGVAWPVALVAGLGGFLISRSIGHRRMDRVAIDPFAIGEPWRQFVQSAQRAGNRLHATVDGVHDGPLKERLVAIAARLDDGLVETWSIARRGDQIDEAVRRLDPTALRSKLVSLEKRGEAAPGPDVDAAIESVRAQLDSTERLRAEAAKTADRLRLTQARLDELVVRAAEVAIGNGDTETYRHDVDDLVIELEALRQAVEEVDRP